MENTKHCPYCGKEIKAVAKKCRFCGKWLEQQDENNVLKDDEGSSENRIILIVILVLVAVILVAGGVWYGYNKGQQNSLVGQSDSTVAKDSTIASGPESLRDSERPDFSGYKKVYEDENVAYYYNDKSFERYDIASNVSSKLLYIDDGSDNSHCNVYPDISPLFATNDNPEPYIGETGIKEIQCDPSGRYFVILFQPNIGAKRTCTEVVWYDASLNKITMGRTGYAIDEEGRIEGNTVVLKDERNTNPDAEFGYEEVPEWRDVYYDFRGNIVRTGRWKGY